MWDRQYLFLPALVEISCLLQTASAAAWTVKCPPADIFHFPQRFQISHDSHAGASQS